MKSGSRIFIDTNAYSEASRNNKNVQKQLQNAEEIFVSVVVVGELYFGFKKGASESRNLELLREFLNDPRVSIVKTNTAIADIYAQVKYTLEASGTPIPDNDIWIAAGAIETDSILLTFDKHFQDIKGLKIVEKN